MPLPSLSELSNAEFMSPLMFQQAQNQIGLGNQEAQQNLDIGAQNLQSKSLANLFAEQQNPQLLQSQSLMNVGQGQINSERERVNKQNADLDPEERAKKRADMLRQVDEDKLKSLYAKGEAGMLDPDPTVAEAAKKMRSSAWDELQRRSKATDAADKAAAIAEGKLEGIRLQQAGMGERGELDRASRERIAAMRAKGAGKGNDILAGVASGKFTYEKAASSFEIMAAMEPDPEMAAKYSKLADTFEKARASDVNRQAGKVDLEKLGIDVKQFQSALGGNAGIAARAPAATGVAPQGSNPTNSTELGMAREMQARLAQAKDPKEMQKEIEDTIAMLPSMPAQDRAGAQAYIAELQKKLGGGQAAPAAAPQAKQGYVVIYKDGKPAGQIPAANAEKAKAQGYTLQ